MDLMGRKTFACKGALLEEYLGEITDFITCSQPALTALGFVAPLRNAVDQLRQVTAEIVGRAASNPCDIGAAAVEYLHLLGHVSYAYLWAKMASVAYAAQPDSFTEGKIKTAQFYFAHLLPKVEGLLGSLRQDSATLMALDAEQF